MCVADMGPGAAEALREVIRGPKQARGSRQAIVDHPLALRSNADGTRNGDGGALNLEDLERTGR